MPNKRKNTLKDFSSTDATGSLIGFLLVNGSATAASTSQSGGGDIRRAHIEADLLDCIVTIPRQLFYSTQIPAYLWLQAKNKNTDNTLGFRDRRKAALFISNTSAPMLDQQPGMIDLWHN